MLIQPSITTILLLHINGHFYIEGIEIYVCLFPINRKRKRENDIFKAILDLAEYLLTELTETTVNNFLRFLVVGTIITTERYIKKS